MKNGAPEGAAVNQVLERLSNPCLATLARALANPEDRIRGNPGAWEA
jgi:hypothetical protein